MSLSKYAESLSTRNCRCFRPSMFFSEFYKICEAARHALRRKTFTWKLTAVNKCLSLTLFLSALRCFSLKIPLLLLPRLLSRLSSLRFLKFRCLFSRAFFCSFNLYPVSLHLYDFPPYKRGLPNATLPRDFPPRKISRRLPSPGASLLPHLHPDSLYAPVDGRTLTS